MARLLPISMSATLLLTGCGQPQPGQGPSAASLMGQGCLVGAAVGAGGGALGSRGSGIVALLGGTIGCAIGVAGGAVLAAKQGQAADTEQQLAPRIAVAHQQAGELRAEAQNDLNTAAQIEESMTGLRRARDTDGTPTSTQLGHLNQARAERARIASRIARAQDQLKALIADTEQMRKDGNDISQPQADQQSIAGSISAMQRALEQVDQAMGDIRA
jgi:hypothetical protein